MTLYYVNKNAQANGDSEVHKSDYIYLLSPENIMYLGDFE